MKILMTGAGGFIGSAFRRTLEAQNHTVIPLFHTDQILNEFDNTFTHVIHLAAYGNHKNQRTGNTEDNIFIGNAVYTYKLLKWTKNIPRFIYISSSSIYGAEFPMSEDTLPVPNTWYGANKYACEQLVYGMRDKSSITIIRPFSVYGPLEASFRFIPTVISSIVNDKEFRLIQSQTHDWIYIDDAVSAILTLLDIPGVWNVGTGRITRNAGIVEKLETILGKKARYIFDTRQSSDSTNWVADISKITSLTTWQPTVSLDEGLKKTAEQIA